MTLLEITAIVLPFVTAGGGYLANGYLRRGEQQRQINEAIDRVGELNRLYLEMEEKNREIAQENVKLHIQVEQLKMIQKANAATKGNDN